MENNFQKLEQQGRQLIKDFCYDKVPTIWDIQFESEQFSRTDMTYFSAFTQVFAELKTRDYLYTQTWNGTPIGWIIEKSKFDELMSRRQTDQDAAVYINLFKNGLVIWDLTNMTPTWINKLCWSDHTCTKKVNKEVAYLSIEQASHIFNHSFTLNTRPK